MRQVRWEELKPNDMVMSYGEPVYTVLSPPKPVRNGVTVKVRLGRTGPVVQRTFVGHMTVEVEP